jgi:hypothetical protein
MVILTILLLIGSAQNPTEADFYQNIEVVEPEGVVLEVGGIETLDNGDLLVSTRRGEIWRIENHTSTQPKFSLWADGLQEPLGLLSHQGWIYSATRGELLRMRDRDGDGSADEFEVVCDDWKISGNYHEYDFGPRVDPEGNLWITLNKPFGPQPFGQVDWRGWAMRIGADGKMQPVCAGLRSPAGVECSPWGDMFYTDNQGEWCGASKLSILKEGEFHGHPYGIESCKLPESQVEYPGTVPDGQLMIETAKQIENYRLPAVWFPYDKMGRSPAGMAWDTTDGAFGPYTGQLFVGDQYQASVLRVFLEQVDGVWQGACFPFRVGLVSGITRVRFNDQGELLVGGTDRGWASLGRRNWGLERLRWTGQTPFEILEMKATVDGFELVFTEPVDAESALDPDAWSMSSYTYKLHSTYGSDEFETQQLQMQDFQLSADGLHLKFSVHGLREGYVHELHGPGVRNQNAQPLLHSVAYYTLQKRLRR